MKKVTYESTVESAYGKTIAAHTNGKHKSVKITGEYDEIESYNELVQLQLVPSNQDIVDMVNAERKQAAKAKRTTEVLKDDYNITKPDPNTPEAIRERMISDAMKANPKLTRETATARVEAVLGGE